MDTVLHSFHSLQTDKALAMRFYALFTSIAKTSRLLQLCASPLLLFWTLSRLSSALHISRLYFDSLASLITSPLFVFFVSNAIIAALFANSRRVLGHDSGAHSFEMELFREFTKRNADHAELSSEVDTDQSRVAEQVNYQDMQIVSDNTTARTLRDQVELDERTDTDSIAEPESDHSAKSVRELDRSDHKRGDAESPAIGDREVPRNGETLPKSAGKFMFS